MCKECRHPGPIQAHGLCKSCYMVRWRAANRDRMKASGQLWRERNADRLRERSKAWRESHKDERRAAHRRWRSQPANAQKVVARVTRWRKENPEKFRENVRQFVGNRRARTKHAPTASFTSADWRELLTAHDHRCHYCGSQPARLTQDHKIPLVHGGAHTKDNIVPACKSCNSRKGTIPYERFIAA